MEKVTLINIELVNKAYIHLLIALKLTIKFAMEPYTKTNLFTYSMATTIVL